jgi:hypothetical protein
MATVKKTQSKGDVRMADLLDRQDGKGKYAPKKNAAITNKKLMETGGKIKSKKY